MTIFDCETYPNCFLLNALTLETGERRSYEISYWRNDFVKLRTDLPGFGEMVGFNSLGFDYPLVHWMMKHGDPSAREIYDQAMRIINGEDKTTIWRSDRYAVQIDLFKIHHFDNMARATSLKVLEFNMRMDNISDLPFKVGTILTREQVEVLREYCWHDVHATALFLEQSREQIAFRRDLAKRHPKYDWLNFSDVKIGKIVFQMELEKQHVPCYSSEGPIQTIRSFINLGDCMPAGIALERPEFRAIYDRIASTTIAETKGAFKDLSATVEGVEYVFGTGGLHASVSNKSYIADDEYMIYDIDVTSLYPSIAITRGYYPKHLGEKFVEVYRQLLDQRMSHPKGSAENAMLKLALNGVYGASGDKYSIFFDTKFTMRITIGGQMMIAKLVEYLLSIKGMEIIQVNTDGITMRIPRAIKPTVDFMCAMWEQLTHLHLESVEYSKMFIADVNSYLAVKTGGSIKRKGRYEYDTGWHQNGSSKVIAKVAEQHLVYGADIESTVCNWSDKMDFMLRAKIPRSSRLEYNDSRLLENTQRYYMSKEGGTLTKIMPPLPKAPDKERRIAIQKGYTVCPCNNIKDATMSVDYDWYIEEIKTLCEVNHA